MIINHTNCEMIPIADLKPHPMNPNKHSSEQIERLAKILEYQNWRYPIKVSNLSGFITSGHGRLMAAELLGETHVPVSFQDYDDQDQEKADLVSDNAISEWAELDMSGINAMLADMDPSFDVDFLGIKDFELEPADKKKPKTGKVIICPDCGHEIKA